jgi:hypothetical protein
MIVSVNKIFERYSSSVFAEYLFAYSPTIKTIQSDKVYKVYFDVAHNDEIIKTNLLMFSEE